MAEIFISYASEDRERAHELAEAFSARGWSVWWDRKIPLGQSFDAVIEKALAEAKCVVVLWSAISAASEWVGNEASEGKRREILVPVFIEPVDAPLAFRRLNGANLSDWHPDSAHPEFDKLSERITELLGQTRAAGSAIPPGRDSYSSTQGRRRAGGQWFRSPTALITLAIVIVTAAASGYFLRPRETPPVPGQNFSSIEDARRTGNPLPDRRDTDMEKRIKDLAGMFGGAIPATSIAKGFHVPDLGFRVAFLTPEQSASTLGAMPPGAVVMEIESGRPMARAGLQVGDVMLSIGGKKLASENDLRQAIFKLGPGKTEYSFRRGGETKTISVDCPSCKAE
jgi:membrane-associated protease RseP (regulator of RpoE activity)